MEEQFEEADMGAVIDFLSRAGQRGNNRAPAFQEFGYPVTMDAGAVLLRYRLKREYGLDFAAFDDLYARHMQELRLSGRSEGWNCAIEHDLMELGVPEEDLDQARVSLCRAVQHRILWEAAQAGEGTLAEPRFEPGLEEQPVREARLRRS